MKQEIIEYLKQIGCTISEDGRVHTENGDYVTLSTLEKEPIADLIYNHRLTQLQSIDYAKNGVGGGSVGIGFNEEEQKWYGFTHRGYGAFGIGYETKAGTIVVEFSDDIHAGFKCETLDDCKKLAIAMSDALD